MSRKNQAPPLLIMTPDVAEHMRNAAWKEKRKQMAIFYKENQSVTMSDVAHRFKASIGTVKKALHQFGVPIDHTRGESKRGRTYRQHYCEQCNEHYRHYHRDIGELPEFSTDTFSTDTPTEYIPESLRYRRERREPVDVSQVGSQTGDEIVANQIKRLKELGQWPPKPAAPTPYDGINLGDAGRYVQELRRGDTDLANTFRDKYPLAKQEAFMAAVEYVQQAGIV